jgi:hypothetical protein
MPTLLDMPTANTGLGLMGLTTRSPQVPEEQAFAAMKVSF